MTELSNRYTLAEPLGSGGMGRVVCAYDRVLERRVAIKFVLDGQTDVDTARERLLREARAAAGLHHPNTVTIFDVGEDDGQLYIVMELEEGPTLADLLHAKGRIDPAETVMIIDAVLNGLSAAHQLGLVHRDVKPSNILLPDSGGVKVTDFGIAKALGEASSELTLTGQLIGTPRYVAPELVSGDEATPSSDLYAVGVVTYQCLSGRLPFEATTPVMMALAHQRDPVPPLADVAPDIDAELAAVVERALVKDPAERFASADSMRRALRDASKGVGGIHDGATTAAVPTSVPGEFTTPVDRPQSVSLIGAPDAVTVTTLSAPDPADGSTSEGREGRPKRWWVAAAATGVLLLALALVVRASTAPPDSARANETMVRGTIEKSTQDEAGEDEAAEEPADDQPPDEQPADEAGDEPVEAPLAGLDDVDSVEALIAWLAPDPSIAGPRGSELLSDLEQLLAGGEQRNRGPPATRLSERVEQWVATGELDADVGRLTVRLLSQYTDG